MQKVMDINEDKEDYAIDIKNNLEKQLHHNLDTSNQISKNINHLNLKRKSTKYDLHKKQQRNNFQGKILQLKLIVTEIEIIEKPTHYTKDHIDVENNKVQEDHMYSNLSRATTNMGVSQPPVQY